jgi:hypothetical protein
VESGAQGIHKFAGLSFERNKYAVFGKAARLGQALERRWAGKSHDFEWRERFGATQ